MVVQLVNILLILMHCVLLNAVTINLINAMIIIINPLNLFRAKPMILNGRSYDISKIYMCVTSVIQKVLIIYYFNRCFSDEVGVNAV